MEVSRLTIEVVCFSSDSLIIKIASGEDYRCASARLWDARPAEVSKGAFGYVTARTGTNHDVFSRPSNFER
jgi:hypothetical protein